VDQDSSINLDGNCWLLKAILEIAFKPTTPTTKNHCFQFFLHILLFL
jgi:hypothetical protein